MTNVKQRPVISGMRRWRLIFALAFAVDLALTGNPAAQAQTFTVLHSFAGGDGAYPQTALVLDTAGNLYGTTHGGGPYGNGDHGYGIVFRLDPQGKETVLYSFTGGTDGAHPSSSLFLDPAGNLYGLASGGGDPACQCGTVFKLTGNGSLVVLHPFTGGTDGANPMGNFVSVNGEFYGVTNWGGSTGCYRGCGVIWQVGQGGRESVVYRFTGGADGAHPRNLIRDQAGNLYGNTDSGARGYGELFEWDTGNQFTTLYAFSSSSDGGAPWGRLVRINGDIYGVTLIGGSDNCRQGDGYGCGVVFRLSPGGTETVLHAFGRWSLDGAFPAGGLLDVSGSLYGTTIEGGHSTHSCVDGCGVVFRIGNTGQYDVLHRFSGETDGAAPQAELIQDAAGNLYGTAAVGGSTNNGVVFKITP
jgi:uncharacterized repeat protein (TIGR03803 family)